MQFDFLIDIFLSRGVDPIFTIHLVWFVEPSYVSINIALMVYLAVIKHVCDILNLYKYDLT